LTRITDPDDPGKSQHFIGAVIRIAAPKKKKTTYIYGHGISSVVVIQLTLGAKEVLYISNPTLEFLTWMSIGQSFLLCVTEFLSQKF
jgi:hypothetical protein